MAGLLLTREKAKEMAEESLEEMGISFDEAWFEAGWPALQAGCRLQLRFLAERLEESTRTEGRQK